MVYSSEMSTVPSNTGYGFARILTNYGVCPCRNMQHCNNDKEKARLVKQNWALTSNPCKMKKTTMTIIIITIVAIVNTLVSPIL